ncbi:hypothetical protein GCM10010112_40130 [Actinoplanes lobatus]|uniref:Uncharacterized protein n=1 Tax=Actinoplanes lobatus TaxID=113568 RepID=A0ABQ4ALV1_9ACTN|nr:hypothetical protein GCM10010112_40130 [Actinoplanes lobatus]GIE41976.1 hypothetical protein Alo02nite_48740 [Actinoplanes lobatus]
MPVPPSLDRLARLRSAKSAQWGVRVRVIGADLPDVVSIPEARPRGRAPVSRGAVIVREAHS